MKTVNMHQAKSQLSALVRDLRDGIEGEIMIALAGQPVARLLPAGHPPSRSLGPDRGLIEIKPGFDDADADITALFEK